MKKKSFDVEVQLSTKETSENAAVLAAGKRLYPNMAAVKEHIDRDLSDFADIFSYAVFYPANAVVVSKTLPKWKNNNTITFRLNLDKPATEKEVVEQIKYTPLADTVWEGQGPWVLTVPPVRGRNYESEYGVVNIKNVKIAKAVAPRRAPSAKPAARRAPAGGCVRQTQKKYTERKSPPYPANHPLCQGTVRVGNDGRTYASVANAAGVYRWVLH